MIPFETVSHSKNFSILLSQRILEIMEEKGKKYTQDFVASGIGISRDTFRAVMKGTRPIYGTELRNLAMTFKLSVDRITMKDVANDADELLVLLSNLKDKYRASLLAQKLADLALGITERCVTLNNLGRANFISNQYEAAHTHWLEAYQYAKKVFEKYNDSNHLFNVLTNLVISFSYRKEYSNANHYLQEVEAVFQSDPKNAGAICYAKAMISENMGDTEATKHNLYKSLEFNLQTNEAIRIGRAEINVAHFEYKMKSYDTAKMYIERALHNLSDDPDTYRIAQKVYAKVLLKLGDRKKATKVIDAALSLFSPLSLTDLHAKFLILKSLATNDSSYAERILNNFDVSNRVRQLSAAFLKQYCIQFGDEAGLMKYSKIEQMLSLSRELLDEEDF